MSVQKHDRKQRFQSSAVLPFLSFPRGAERKERPDVDFQFIHAFVSRSVAVDEHTDLMINGTSLLLSSVPARARALQVAATASALPRSRKSFPASARKSVRYTSRMSAVEVCVKSIPGKELLGDCKKEKDREKGGRGEFDGLAHSPWLGLVGGVSSL